MITLKTAKETKSFNLKNFDREKALLNAWHAMHGDVSFDKKSFKIHTSAGTLEYKISEILDCVFDEAVHCECGACDVH